VALLDGAGEAICHVTLESSHNPGDASIVADPNGDTIYVVGDVYTDGLLNPVGFYVDVIQLVGP
jgi:hypothetical protein